MFANALVAVLALAGSALGIDGPWYGASPECARRWEPCGGGPGYNGSTCCLGLNACVFKNDWFSMCQPLDPMPTGFVAEYGVCDPASPGCEPLTECKPVQNKPGIALCLDPVHERQRQHDCSKADRWEQCGGIEWTGPTACRGQNACVRVNDHFHMCTPLEDAKDIACGAEWAACGGKSYKGPTCCADGLQCVFVNEWFSQCIVPAA